MSLPPFSRQILHETCPFKRVDLMFSFIITTQIFILVVIYGLFHGLIFLPVLLSLIGPPSFDVHQPKTEVAITPDELEPQLMKTLGGHSESVKKDDDTVREINTHAQLIMYYLNACLNIRTSSENNGASPLDGCIGVSTIWNTSLFCEEQSLFKSHNGIG